MTRTETIRYASELLKRAAALNGEAWKALAQFSNDEEINEAVEVASDMGRADMRDTLTDDDAFKAGALMDWWNDQYDDAIEEDAERMAGDGVD